MSERTSRAQLRTDLENTKNALDGALGALAAARTAVLGMYYLIRAQVTELESTLDREVPKPPPDEPEPAGSN